MIEQLGQTACSLGTVPGPAVGINNDRNRRSFLGLGKTTDFCSMTLVQASYVGIVLKQIMKMNLKACFYSESIEKSTWFCNMRNSP